MHGNILQVLLMQFIVKKQGIKKANSKFLVTFTYWFFLTFFTCFDFAVS